MTAVRIDVLGAPGAGRTTFVRTISELTVLSTEPAEDDDDAGGAAEDVGRITVDRDLVLHLVGRPTVESSGGPALVGRVLLVDGARADLLAAAAELLAGARAGDRSPYVVVVRPDDDLGAVRAALGVGEHEAVLRCDARDRTAVKRVLLALLQAAAAGLAA